MWGMLTGKCAAACTPGTAAGEAGVPEDSSATSLAIKDAPIAGRALASCMRLYRQHKRDLRIVYCYSAWLQSSARRAEPPQIRRPIPLRSLGAAGYPVPNPEQVRVASCRVYVCIVHSGARGNGRGVTIPICSRSFSPGANLQGAAGERGRVTGGSSRQGTGHRGAGPEREQRVPPHRSFRVRERCAFDSGRPSDTAASG
ncbi:hypothetical protein AAFF_G00393360 [Aldrovandia affinis]|uniref:Uncharacterized protein n=1 Tax=Aldrovandia affinis TaxID=143900 RepID=A0AAD7SDY7_9TELE|nr:hypothetical protein AAFF_G00393360 [Aldrovandia affinis]